MLINCTNTTDSKDIFVINPPAVLPAGARISYHDRYYIIENVSYDDESGVIDYAVSPDKSRAPKDVDESALDLCRTHQKLQAVKYIKETLGLGLKEAKDYIDNLCAKHNIR